MPASGVGALSVKSPESVCKYTWNEKCYTHKKQVVKDHSFST
jgi:hypothetical protein